MIHEEYVSFQQAKSLKDLGFPQSTDLYYGLFDDMSNIEDWTIIPISNSYEFSAQDNCEEYYSCPTLSLVQKWLSTEKNIELYCEATFINSSDKFYTIHILGYLNDQYFHIDSDEEWNWKDGYVITYNKLEDVLSVGIDKCIELLKEK